MQALEPDPIPQEVYDGLARIQAICTKHFLWFSQKPRVLMSGSWDIDVSVDNRTIITPHNWVQIHSRKHDIAKPERCRELMFGFAVRAFSKYINYEHDLFLSSGSLSWTELVEVVGSNNLSHLLEEGELLHPMVEWARELGIERGEP